MTQLGGFEHYFLHWLRDYKITGKIEKQMQKEFVQQVASTFEEDQKLFEQWNVRTVQHALVPFLQAFIKIQVGEFIEARKNMVYIEQLISFSQEKSFMEDYVQGMEYIYQLLNIHLSSAQVDCLRIDFDSPIFTEYFNEPSLKTKLVLAVARWMLNAATRERDEESIDNLREIIELDPLNWIWHYSLYVKIRFRRRVLRGKYSSHPDRDEIEALAKAVEHSKRFPEKDQLSCNAAMSLCLAEIVRSKMNTGDWVRGVVVGSMTFRNLGSLVAYIKESATEAMMDVSSAFGVYMRYGDILGLVLPIQYRDLALALSLIKTAYIMDPNNSKVNHKMASITLKLKSDTKRAAEFLRLAVDTSSRNFSAWIDLLCCLLANSQSQIQFEDVDALLKNVKESEHKWFDVQRGTLSFFEGIVEFLKGGSERKAVEFWLHSIEWGFADGFKELERIKDRFSWPKEHGLTYDAVLYAIDNQNGNLDIDKIYHLQQLVSEARKSYNEFKTRTGRKDENAMRNSELQKSRRSHSPSWR